MTDIIIRPPLRLMIYDASDIKTNIQRIRKGLSNPTRKALDAILPDDIEKSEFDIPLGLAHTWMSGGHLYRLLGRIDDCRGFSTWSEALEWLATTHPDQRISQIQYWGHGSPGRAWMLEDGALDAQSPLGRHADVLSSIRQRLTDNAMIWFRCCSIFSKRIGHEFAKAWANSMNCRIAGHTHVIGFWQAGLHSLRPGQEPIWSVTEGVGVDGKNISSSWSSPNRTWFLGNEVPENW